MNDDDMNVYNTWLENPMIQAPFCTPFIVRERIVKEGDHYVLKKIVCNPCDFLMENDKHE